MGETKIRKIPITYMMGVYNEEKRIRSVLEHAVRWADEIIILDKSSTDHTRNICLQYGDKIRVIDIPYSLKGEDDMVSSVKRATNDWIYFGTASEIPTRQLIDRIQRVLSETNGELDLVYIPRKIFSFGLHSPLSPWSVSYYPFLINRKKAIVSNVIHKNFSPRNKENTARIEYSDDCCVHHYTHSTAKLYMEDMLQYFQVEARSSNGSYDELRRQCLENIRKHIRSLRRGGEDLFGHYCAWQIYWLGTALFLWERQRGVDVEEYYEKLKKDLLEREWIQDKIPDRETSNFWEDGRIIKGEEDLLLELAKRPICGHIRVIYVIGAHLFQEEKLIFRMFPNLEKVYLFEPIPEFHGKLTEMARRNRRIEVLPYALGDKDEKAQFHLTDNFASSSLLPLGKHKEIFPHVRETGSIAVECRTLESVIKEHDLRAPDMLFIDAQGAEYKILSSLPPDVRSLIKLIYTEASTEELYVGARPLSEIEELLKQDFRLLGYAPLTKETPTHGNAMFVNHAHANFIGRKAKQETILKRLKMYLRGVLGIE